jgi:hypothetical protein
VADDRQAGVNRIEKKTDHAKIVDLEMLQHMTF